MLTHLNYFREFADGIKVHWTNEFVLFANAEQWSEIIHIATATA